MSKTITVWGNPGCGKSMFCCNLSKVLTAGKQKAIIINADSSTPMPPCVDAGPYLRDLRFHRKCAYRSGNQ